MCLLRCSYWTVGPCTAPRVKTRVHWLAVQEAQVWAAMPPMVTEDIFSLCPYKRLIKRENREAAARAMTWLLDGVRWCNAHNKLWRYEVSAATNGWVSGVSRPEDRSPCSLLFGLATGPNRCMPYIQLYTDVVAGCHQVLVPRPF